MSFEWNFYQITENSYWNRSNLSVIRKKIHKIQHEIWYFWHSFSCLKWITETRNFISKKMWTKEFRIFEYFNKNRSLLCLYSKSWYIICSINSRMACSSLYMMLNSWIDCFYRSPSMKNEKKNKRNSLIFKTLKDALNIFLLWTFQIIFWGSQLTALWYCRV